MQSIHSLVLEILNLDITDPFEIIHKVLNVCL